jgi:RNase P/RNase MRP subunit p29
MISIRLSGKILRCVLGGGALCIAFSPPSVAQVQTTKSETHGTATREVTVERGEIVYVNGNTVVMRMDNGSLREFDNIPESSTFMVDGNRVHISEAKVGMKIEKQTVRITKPKVVTTVETVTGKVWHVSPPNHVILTLENGENQTFTIPKGQKFTVDGVDTDAFALRKGMTVSAQRITEVPETVIEHEIKISGTAPPTPAAPTPGVPILIVAAQPTPPVATAEATKSPAAEEPAPKKLPTTASELPLIGLLGALLCVLSLTAMTIRMIVSRFAASQRS